LLLLPPNVGLERNRAMLNRKHSICGRAIVAILLAFQAAPILPARAQADPAIPDWWPGTAERMAIRSQIEALTTEYYYRVDHGESERVAELFTPDCVFQPGGTERMIGREAVRAYYANRPKTWVTRHVSTNLRLRYVNPDRVEIIRLFTHYLGDTRDGPGPYPAVPSVAEYREVAVRGDDGQWRFESRVAIPLFARKP